jgi:hypothetical protein
MVQEESASRRFSMANETAPEFRTMMRYLAKDDAFEYKADETTESVKIPAANMVALRNQLATSNAEMAKLLDFLVENAKSDPGKWVEAVTTSVSKDQALV